MFYFFLFFFFDIRGDDGRSSRWWRGAGTAQILGSNVQTLLYRKEISSRDRLCGTRFLVIACVGKESDEELCMCLCVYGAGLVAKLCLTF